MAEISQLSGDGPPGGGSTVNTGLNAGDDGAPVKPESVPDKFWDAEAGQVNVEALSKSYAELERKSGQPQATSSDDQPPSTEESSNFELSRYEEEYRTNDNSLKDDTYKELHSKFGLEKNEVDNYIRYRQSDADSFAQEIFDMAGGEDQYRSLLGWASSNLPEAEIESINTTLNTSDRDQVRVAMMKLNNKYRESVGVDPKLLGGSTSDTGSELTPFASLQEAVEARRDKRFAHDPAYRAQWEKRVGSSGFVNNK